jgi:hypothetical protein
MWDLLRPPSLAEQLTQKSDELGTGVALGRLAFHFAGLHIQRHGLQLHSPRDSEWKFQVTYPYGWLVGPGNQRHFRQLLHYSI